MVDSNDPGRFGEAAQELQVLLAEEAVQNVSILVFANKQDLPNAVSAAKIAEKLDLAKLSNSRDWCIQPCTALRTSQGLHAGLDWLSQTLAKKVN